MFNAMSVQSQDRNTIDMFSRPERGRPKSSPYDRTTQLKISKRLQRGRDKHKGMRRVEIKLAADLVERLDDACVQCDLSRAELIGQAIVDTLDGMR